tara:strand:+ start:630 stop:1175 length:546 start_codon:yes stop_codon:yes gene_type:complete
MKEVNLPEWRLALTSSKNKEGKSISKRWLQIATTSKDNLPRLRTIVFRGWLENHSMLIYTDRRSEKIKDINNNNKVELLWFFPKSKSQYRFKGEAYEIKDNIQFWNSLSEKSKLSWFWPTPGERLSEIKFFDNPKNLNRPDTFFALGVKIDYVELLKLERPIHKRCCWSSQDNWTRIALNP